MPRIVELDITFIAIAVHCFGRLNYIELACLTSNFKESKINVIQVDGQLNSFTFKVTSEPDKIQLDPEF